MARVTALVTVSFLLVVAVSIWLALRVTPLQTVSAAGQTAQVGAAAPSWASLTHLSLSGPGELDLFGQVIPTRIAFTGPIRPWLQLDQISITPQIVQELRAEGTHRVELTLSQQLAGGWERYFLWETLLVVGFVALGLLTGYAVRRRHVAWKMVAGGVALAVAINVGGIVLTAASTPRILRSVRTLDELVGVDPAKPPAAPVNVDPNVQVVVMGDSTASGWGLPWVAGATALDQGCGRSADSYAADLATTNGWNVQSLACGSATINNGLLGAQVLSNGQIAAPQFSIASEATHAKLIVVSVGADDLKWSVMTQLCAASPVCNDKISGAYFTQLLGSFTRSYYKLLTELDDLPWHPAVVVNEYYSPFGASVGCLSQYGMTQAKASDLVSRLDQLNTVLAQGATAFHFGLAQPKFTGHELCTTEPYVQGPSDPAPMHPNAQGELAIALADEQAIASQGLGAGLTGPAGGSSSAVDQPSTATTSLAGGTAQAGGTTQ
ncbi:MAG TPA: GDSL-type esterase/lipase family protein [Trebonia sp.]|jgi:lysophospholipase L1-like esterase|nr:GDSL-type esterase/lipase family protein [Trebonia sp.]